MGKLRTIDPTIDRAINDMGLVVKARITYERELERSPGFQDHVKRQLAHMLGKKVEEYADFEKLLGPGNDPWAKGRDALEAEVVIMSKAELALLMSRQFVRYG